MLGLSLFGCAGRNAEYYGSWIGTVDRADPDMPDDYIKKGVNTIRLEINDNGTFRMVDSMIPKSGTFKVGSEGAKLKITHVMERPISEMGDGAATMNKEISLVLKEDGTLVFTDPGGFDEGPVVMKKDSQPDKR